jgi:hypothetical protein
MAKKSRRARATTKAAAPVKQTTNAAQSTANTAAATKSYSRRGAAAPAAVIQPANYDYVKSDLIQIGIIAALLLVIMIILTFIPALRT